MTAMLQSLNAAPLNVMGPDDFLDCRYQLLYRAECSSRYHRRRLAFLNNVDMLFNLVIVVAGAATFAQLAVGAPGWLARTGAALVTVIALAQIYLRVSAQAGAHTGWLKRWNVLHKELTLNTSPSESDVRRWVEVSTEIGAECAGDLRALYCDCENAAARVMGIPDRQVEIKPWQRAIIHLGTLQSSFPKVPDPSPPLTPSFF
ncbi:MAG: hypothetical protein ACM3YM_03775 [Sphingomonadales bacterium]